MIDALITNWRDVLAFGFLIVLTGVALWSILMGDDDDYDDEAFGY